MLFYYGTYLYVLSIGGAIATITTHLQDQYAFIHDALSDHITCGDTSMMAHELRRDIVDMNKKDGTGKSGFENQFEVRMLI